jgi:hypothetical protein
MHKEVLARFDQTWLPLTAPYYFWRMLFSLSLLDF